VGEQKNRPQRTPEQNIATLQHIKDCALGSDARTAAGWVLERVAALEALVDTKGRGILGQLEEEQRKVAALEAKLERYGSHTAHCTRSEWPDSPCDCGFDAALGEEVNHAD